MIISHETIPGVSQGGFDAPVADAAPRNLDRFGRRIDYMRLSITDRCNERCLYCLPEGFKGWKSRAETMTDAEVVACARVFAAHGVRKFRITGGEPLIRAGVTDLIGAIAAQPGVNEVVLSTNGVRLAPLAAALRRAGVASVNVSLDALDADLYAKVTGGRLDAVLDGIRAAKAAGMSVKLNTVLMRGVNEHEVRPIIEWAAAHDCVARFIELMPLSRTDVLTEKNFLPLGHVMRDIAGWTTMRPDERRHGSGPATYRILPELGATVGFIGAITNLAFCQSCNKMRMTADGKLRPCLGQHDERDLMPGLRPRIDESRLATIFAETLRAKPEAHAFRENYEPGRHMTAIGG